MGQDAVATSKAFHETVHCTGIVISRVDGDAKGGAALSMRASTGVPVSVPRAPASCHWPACGSVTRAACAASLGGVALPQIKYMGTGERSDDLREFDPKDIADRLLGRAEQLDLAARVRRPRAVLNGRLPWTRF